MKTKLIHLLLTIVLSNTLYAETITYHINIINQTERTFRVSSGGNYNNSPIVDRNGGSKQWDVLANDDKLTTIDIVHIYTSIPCLSANNEGIFALNPEHYTNDTVTIIVNTDAENGLLLCSCSGSACDVGYKKG